MSVQQAELSAFRWLTVSGAQPAPTDGGGGMFTMSPRTSTGLITTGLLFMLKACDPFFTSATAGAGGFTVTPWIGDALSNRWAAGTAFSASFDQVFTTFDFDACQLYFQIGNVSVGGFIMIGICEQ